MRKATGDRLFVRLGNAMVPTPYAPGHCRSDTPGAGRHPHRAGREPGIRPRHLAAQLRYLSHRPRRGLLPAATAGPPQPHRPRRAHPHPADAARGGRGCLRNGEVDLAIGNLPDFRAGFYQQRLFRDRYVCMVRKDHPSIGERITARQFAAASHAIVTPGGWGHGIIERTLIEHGLEQRIALRMQNFLVLASIVATTDLVAIVPHSVGSQLSQHNDVKLLPQCRSRFRPSTSSSAGRSASTTTRATAGCGSSSWSFSS
jgi:DNA-binding transcriptional LysR family regulator